MFIGFVEIKWIETTQGIFLIHTINGVYCLSLKDALKSRLFQELQNGGVLMDDHKGGCVLYEKRHQVEALL